MTKVDSQVLLPLNYFPELDRSVQQRSGCGPVVWQPLLAGLMNRNRSIGATRALTSMRCFSYPGIFALNLMCVTCYSAPLMQYVKMGLHHPNYLGEDCMMLAQATISEGQKFFLWFPVIRKQVKIYINISFPCHKASSLIQLFIPLPYLSSQFREIYFFPAISGAPPGRSAQLAVLPVVVAVAPPLDASCWGALREAARQGARWAAQVAEAGRDLSGTPKNG